MRRYFGEDIETIAAHWREDPIIQVQLRQDSRYSGTTDGACLVVLESGHRAFVKPRPEQPSLLTIAREKIAADIAYDLGLPAAPVLIRPRCSMWKQDAAISLVSLPSPRHWGAPDEQRSIRAMELLECLRVFWTWIGETDHEGNHENLLYEVHEGAIKLCSIDHGRSLGHGVGSDVLALEASIGYGTAALPGANAARDAFIGRIQSIGDGSLDIIVGRLERILTAGEQNLMLDLLKRRREHLPALLATKE